MKKHFITIFSLMLVIFVLTSCAAEKTAGAGEVRLYDTQEDSVLPPDYSPETEAGLLSCLDTAPTAAENIQNERVISLGGQEYRASFRISVNRFMSHYRYNVFTYRHPSSTDTTEFYVVPGENEKLIGFQHNQIAPTLNQGKNKTEAELKTLAIDALGEFTDAEYYEHVSALGQSEDGTFAFKFYNAVGDIEVADYSTVRLAPDGTVISVIATPEPEILKALGRITSLDGAEFDRRVESEVSRKYADLRRDDEEMLAEVVYEGVSIISRVISIDDDGKPVVLYSVVPEMRYDITYRSEAAANRIKNGVDTHESGVTSRTVYVAVGIE